MTTTKTTATKAMRPLLRLRLLSGGGRAGSVSSLSSFSTMSTSPWLEPSLSRSSSFPTATYFPPISFTSSCYDGRRFLCSPYDDVLLRQGVTTRNFSTTTSATTNTNTSAGAPLSGRKEEEDNDDDNEKKDQLEPVKPTFRSMVRKYGPIFVGTYLTVYVSTWASLFAGIESGLLDPAYILSFFTSSTHGADGETVLTTADLILEVLNKYSWTQPAVPFVEKYPSVANLAVAWIATKPTEPIRFGVTVMVLPRVARALGYDDQKVTKEASAEATAAAEAATPGEKKE